MSFEHQFVGQFVAFSAGDLATQASRELLRLHPELGRRYRPLAETKWTETFASRLAELAAALNAGAPEIFANQLAWARAAFVARKVPLDDLRVSTQVLWQVVHDATPPEDRDTVRTYFEGALAALNAAPDRVPTTLSTKTPHGRLAAAYLLAILEGDRLSASRLVVDAVKAGTLSAHDAYIGVFVPVQHELGRMWHMNEVSIAEEHFATATTQMVMAQVMEYTPRMPRDGRVMLAASVQGNSHDLGVRFIADFFELAGWRAVYLGPNVPIEDLLLAVSDFGTHLVALSVCLPTQLRAAEDQIAAIRQADLPARPKVIVGGRAFEGLPNLWKQFGADGYASDAGHALRIADELVPLPPRS